MYKYFDENIYGSDINMSDFKELNRVTINGKEKGTKNNTYYFFDRLGEVINNGIKYFGGYKVVDYKHTAKFICPKCNELFRANTKKIQDGSIKDCGCTK